MHESQHHSLLPNDIQITNSVSADYDKLTAFFEELGSYLHRLKILEHDLPPFHELKMALAEVLTSVLVLCGISTKYSKKNRIGNYYLVYNSPCSSLVVFYNSCFYQYLAVNAICSTKKAVHNHFTSSS